MPKFGKASKSDEYWRRKQNSLSPGPIYNFTHNGDVSSHKKLEKVPQFHTDIYDIRQRRTYTDFTKIYPHSYNMPSTFNRGNNRGNSIGPPSKYLDELFHKNRLAPTLEDKNSPPPTKYDPINSSKLSTCRSSSQYLFSKDARLVPKGKINSLVSPSSYKFDKLIASSNFINSEGYSFGRSIKNVDVREWNQNYNSARAYIKG